MEQPARRRRRPRRHIRATRALSKWASLFAACLGLGILAGWLLDAEAMNGVLPGVTTMKANTAVGLTLAALALWLLHDDPPAPRRLVVARLCSGAAALIAALTLAEYTFGAGLGIDELLARDVESVGATVHPGRMAPATALSLAMLAASLMFVSTRHQIVAQVLALVVSLVSLLALIGYVYGAEALYRIGPYSSMAVYTAIGFGAVALGVLAVAPTRGLMIVVSSDGPGGQMARRLLPIAVTLPIALGALVEFGRRVGAFDVGFDASLLIALHVVVFVSVIWWNARSLNRGDVERQWAATALRALEERFHVAFNASPFPSGIAELDTGEFVDVNDAFVDAFGYTRDEVIGRSSVDIGLWATAEDRLRLVERIEADRRVRNFEARVHTKSREARDILLSAEIIEIDKRPCILTVSYDVTDRKRLEEQLRQSQRMEAVGRLAGGVAHDFNNLLTIIGGYAALVLRRLAEDDPIRQDVLEIVDAGKRAADLTRQLLAFSRKQILQPTLFNLNATVAEMGRMLGRLIGEDVELVVRADQKLGSVLADKGQIEQVVANLVVNSRDAMPGGGQITIETRNVTLDETYTATHLEARPGRYVMLAVTDTGVGMDDETRSHIFEPFFTTKAVGSGTGLGLATVYGIVKQTGGSIEVYSEQSHGTTFKVFLPRVDAEPDAADAPRMPAAMPRGFETILLVEDEPKVRALAVAVLGECGYTVLDAGTGSEARVRCEMHPGSIHLLVTDVVLPGMNGRELAEAIREKCPSVRVLFMSGYTEDAVVRHGVLDEGIAFLAKPFTPDDLARRVREVLDS